MTEYAHNPETGEVMKRNGQGWEKVKSARNASGDVIINDGQGWVPLPRSNAAQAQAQSFTNDFLAQNKASNVMELPPKQQTDFLRSLRDRGFSGKVNTAELGFRTPSASDQAKASGRAAADGVGRNSKRLLAAAQGATLGTADEMASGLSALGSGAINALKLRNPLPAMRDTYSQKMGLANQALADYRKEAPIESIASEAVPGLVAFGGPVIKAGGRIRTAMASGAAGAGAYSVASQDADRIVDRARNLPINVAAGAVLGPTVHGARAIGNSVRDVFGNPLKTLEASAIGQKSVNKAAAKQVGGVIRDAGGYSRDDINAGISAINHLVGEGVEGPVVPTRLKDQLIEQFPNAEEGINQYLRDARNKSSSQGANLIEKGISEDNNRVRDFVHEAGKRHFGDKGRVELRASSIDEMNRLGEEAYQPIIAAGPKDFESGKAISELLSQPRFQKFITNELADDLEAEGIDFAAYAANNPVEAAHWLQSRARELADSKGQLSAKTGRVEADRNMTKRRQELLGALEEAAPGYRETRQAYGDEAGNIKSLNFGKRLRSQAGDSIKVDDLKREFASLSGKQQEAAKASVLEDAVAAMTKNTTKGEAGKFTSIKGTDYADALEVIFGSEGRAFAEDIARAFAKHTNDRNLNVGSSTMRNLMSADQRSSGVIPRAIGRLSKAITSPDKAGRGVDALANRGRQERIDLAAELLMSKIEKQPRIPAPSKNGKNKAKK